MSLCEVVREWAAIRREYINTKRASNGMACDEAEEGAYNEYCRHRMYGMGEPLPREQWCESCLSRDALHVHLIGLSRQRAAIIRRMARLAEQENSSEGGTNG